MTKGMFELKREELRAVIGGATYYSSVNKLPTMSASAVVARSPALPAGPDRSTSR